MLSSIESNIQVELKNLGFLIISSYKAPENLSS